MSCFLPVLMTSYLHIFTYCHTLSHTVSYTVGAAVCRALLDGIDDQDALEAMELQSRVTEGRCCVCMGSTFEEDCEDEGDEIILCDGCNAEAHIRCLGYDAVPSTEWHCSTCSERVAAREARAGHGFKDVDSYRDTDAEESLIVRSFEKANGDEVDDALCLSCAYCGASELDICSPLVVGQSRVEHDAAVAAGRAPTVDGFYPDKKDTTVRFVTNDGVHAPPPLEVPYMPLVTSGHGRKMIEEGDGQALIVHQVRGAGVVCGVWCGGVCCAVLCCVVLWCGVVWCGVVCCAVLRSIC